MASKVSPVGYPRNHPLDGNVNNTPPSTVNDIQTLLMEMGIGGHGGDGDYIQADQVKQAQDDIRGISPVGKGTTIEQLLQLIGPAGGTPSNVAPGGMNAQMLMELLGGDLDAIEGELGDEYFNAIDANNDDAAMAAVDAFIQANPEIIEQVLGGVLGDQERQFDMKQR